MSAERERPKALKGKEARKQRILATAQSLVREEGTPEISMRALAEGAGVSMMTLYNLIGTRDDILILLVKEQTKQSISKIRWSKTANAVESVLAIPGHYFAYLSSDPSYLRILNTVFYGSLGRELRIEIIEPRRRWWSSIVSEAVAQGEISSGVNIPALVVNLESILSGGIREWSYDGISIGHAEARVECGFCLALLGIVDSSMRDIVEQRLQAAQTRLIESSAGEHAITSMEQAS